MEIKDVKLEVQILHERIEAPILDGSPMKLVSYGLVEFTEVSKEVVHHDWETRLGSPEVKVFVLPGFQVPDREPISTVPSERFRIPMISPIEDFTPLEVLRIGRSSSRFIVRLDKRIMFART